MTSIFSSLSCVFSCDLFNTELTVLHLVRLRRCFSLPVAYSFRMQTNTRGLTIASQRVNLHSSPMKLHQTETSTIEPSVVAADKGPLSAIWNEKTKLPFYLIIWYVGNIYYNIFNKKACIALGKNAAGASNLHWALSAMQLFVGVLFVIPMWLTGVRDKPNMTMDNWKELSPVGLWPPWHMPSACLHWEPAPYPSGKL